MKTKMKCHWEECKKAIMVFVVVHQTTNKRIAFYHPDCYKQIECYLEGIKPIGVFSIRDDGVFEPTTMESAIARIIGIPTEAPA